MPHGPVPGSTLDNVGSVSTSSPESAYCTIPNPVAGRSHLMILETLQNVYNLADKIPPQEQPGFTLFCIFATQVPTSPARQFTLF